MRGDSALSHEGHLFSQLIPICLVLSLGTLYLKINFFVAYCLRVGFLPSPFWDMTKMKNPTKVGDVLEWLKGRLLWSVIT